MAHSLGPWRLNPVRAKIHRLHVKDGDYEDVMQEWYYVSGGGGDSDFVADMVVSRTEKGAANARLAIAAPELLDVLKKVRKDMSSECVVEGCTCGDGWNHDDPALIAEIDAAIAKATGVDNSVSK